MDSEEEQDQADRDRIITGTMFNMDWNWVQRVQVRDWISGHLGGATRDTKLDDDSDALAALSLALAGAAGAEPWRLPQTVVVGCDAHCPARAVWRVHGLYFCGHHAREHGIAGD